MDVRTFIAEMTKALAWPAALVIVSLVFRKTIKNLLYGIRLRQIKKGEWSLDFETAAQEVRAELPSSAKRAILPSESRQLSGETVDLANIAPTAAIIQQWNKLESRVREIAIGAGIQQQLLTEVLRALVGKGVVKSTAADAILGLRNMRNLAVHAPRERLTSAQALEFITMADALTWGLEHDLKEKS